MRKLLLLLVVSVLGLLGSAGAAQYGTPAEAKAMLERAVAELKQNQAKALEEFTKGAAGFKDRDLYPYCIGPDGKFTAHPKLVGQSVKGLQDKSGKNIGDMVMAAAKEGAISEVSYLWPRPNETQPTQKVAYVTKVGDQICAVGYYK